MAKKDEPLGIFTKTEKPAEATPSPTQADNSDLDTGPILPSGVGLRQGEVEALKQIAAAYDISRNALLRYAARRLILDYRAGKLDLSGLVEKPPEHTPRNRMRYPKH